MAMLMRERKASVSSSIRAAHGRVLTGMGSDVSMRFDCSMNEARLSSGRQTSKTDVSGAAVPSGANAAAAQKASLRSCHSLRRARSDVPLSIMRPPVDNTCASIRPRSASTSLTKMTVSAAPASLFPPQRASACIMVLSSSSTFSNITPA